MHLHVCSKTSRLNKPILFAHEVCSSGFQQPRFTRRVEKIGRGLPGNRNRNQMRISSFSWLIIKFCQIALASSIFPMHGPGETNISLSRWYSLVWFKGTLTGTHGSTIGCFVPVNFPVNPNPFPYALCIFAYIWHSLVVNVGKIFQHHFSQMGIEANRLADPLYFFLSTTSHTDIIPRCSMVLEYLPT